ncbi:alpha-hydroxy-acid oxidizing protein [Hallella mizrahii]|uniref:FMN-dependent dehydrogenase n=1 Tax=Hallella mizrahii TaxID=2606637 RepID=A0A7K0KJ55_9BACT|nr:alpha-hydroxy-acid oxidizing protein [Hallella mizrahii]MST85899.1 FMN-dependent dehydrogenase [Hallella mizrahii]
MENKKNSPWPGPEGLIPVTSGKSDDANVINRRYLDSLLVEMRVIDSVKPCLTTRIFGREFSSPIMMPAFSHLNKVGKNGRKPMEEYAFAAKQLRLLNWVGMEPDEEYAGIAAVDAPTVRIIKPFADHDIILEQIDFAVKHGAIAVGIDIDHIANKDGGYDVVDGHPLGPVMLADLKDYVKAARVPFVAKGVLSVNDALKARDAGCRAVLVSHHHGRIPFGIPPTAVLPRIKDALQGSGMMIFCDCGIDTGYDAYKALALGADAVAVGRGILAPLLKEGTEGVVRKIRQMNEQLSELMLYTGIKDTASFDSSIIHPSVSVQ